MLGQGLHQDPPSLSLMAESNASALLLLDLIRQEREKQRAHFDALDNKAGLVVGFAALLVTLLPELVFPARVAALVAAIAAGACALAAFWPRRYPMLSVRRLREYVAADAQLTRTVVVDTLVEVNDATTEMLSAKGRRLRWSLVFLSLTGLAVGAGILWGG